MNPDKHHFKRACLKFCFLSIILLHALGASAQDGRPIYLYPGQDTTNAPAIFVNLAPKANASGAAVLICPGGGYTMLAYSHEGNRVAKWFNERGVHAIILRYSLGKFDGTGHKHPDMLNDAKAGFRLIRSHAEEWGINPDMIGVMGFSAGGHLAATLATHFDDGQLDKDGKVIVPSCLPNFCILGYPVITMNDEYTHWGSRRFLLGPTPKDEDIQNLSNQLQVKPQTPPTFLFHTSDDKSVPVQNSIEYYLALRKMGIPVEMHIFEHGPHGVGLATSDPTLSQWTTLLEDWLRRWKVIKTSKE